MHGAMLQRLSAQPGLPHERVQRSCARWRAIVAIAAAQQADVRAPQGGRQPAEKWETKVRLDDHPSIGDGQISFTADVQHASDRP